MVGRINLSVLENDRKTAELGYRIGENVTNLGYASEAVKLVLDKAFTTYGLNKIIAGTATDNLASQRVLLKNGFTFSKIIENDLQIHNEWIHTAVFEIRNTIISSFPDVCQTSTFLVDIRLLFYMINCKNKCNIYSNSSTRAS